MIWDSEQFWLKAKTFAGRASESFRETGERTFWRILSLELLSRAALTKIHPALNADPQNEGLNLMYAFGITIRGEPRSIPIHAVTARLERIVPDFGKPQREFCDFLMIKRNEEIHTCALPFETLSESKWLPGYYEVCDILNRFLGKSLDTFFDPQEATSAKQLIVARNSEKRSEVLSRIGRHKALFGDKPEAERLRLRGQQDLVSTSWLYPSASVTCPACGCRARITGALERTSEPVYKDDALVVEKLFLASRVDCGACGLELRDIAEIHIAELNPHFIIEEHTDLHEYYEPEDFNPYMNM